MSHPIVEHKLELGGIKTRALELDGEGVPLLLFHGFADSADCWRLVLDRLRQAGRAAIALDMPGFGTASHLDREEELLLPQLDRFVTAAVNHFASGRGVYIVGNSLGGCMALRAAENPELPITGIVPVAPAGLGLAGWLRIIEGAPLLKAMLSAPVPVPQPVVQGVVGRMYRTFAFANGRAVDAGAVRAFAGHIKNTRDARRILATARRVVEEIQDPFNLHKIRCPVLLVWGDRDRMVYATGAERVLREVEGSRLVMLDNTGHCPQVEDPDRLTELLLGFPDASVGVGGSAAQSAA
jgi:pimeloyl-ACP methyl ester carboxylesterase